MINELYDLLESLIIARYSPEKLIKLEAINSRLDIFRYQPRLLLDFQMIPVHRYEFAGKFINEIGMELGGSPTESFMG